MSTRHRWIGTLVVLLMMSAAGQGRAQTPSLPSGVAAPLTAAEIQAGRQKMITEILTTDVAGAARWGRAACAAEDMPASIAQTRAEGRIMTPDAADSCIAAMTRQAHDGALLSLYQDTLEREIGNYADAPALPQRIVDAIRSGSNRVDLGNGRSLSVTPGLALDVGFTAAYENKGDGVSGTVKDPAELKAVTENCVGQRGDDRTCFTAGYIQGAVAYAASR